MKCKWYEFHDWIDIKKFYKQDFEGTECEYSYAKYRICRKCKTATQHIHYGMDSYTSKLNECETKIVLSKCTFHDEPINGVYYRLKDEPKPPKDE